MQYWILGKQFWILNPMQMVSSPPPPSLAVTKGRILASFKLGSHLVLRAIRGAIFWKYTQNNEDRRKELIALAMHWQR